MSHTASTNGINEFHDIPYTEIGHEKHKLDIYVPSTEGKKPVLLFIHGGGWKQGDRKWRNNFISGNLYANVGKTFALEGFVSVVISYRLSSLPRSTKLIASTLFGFFGTLFSYIVLNSISYFINNPALTVILLSLIFLFCFFMTIYRLSEGSHLIKHPDHIQDVAKAYGWVTKNIHRYQGDENNIFIMGHSAGAHLATLLALDDTYLREEGISNSGLQGVIGLSGVYNWGRLSKTGIWTRLWYISPVLGSRSPSRDHLWEISPLTHTKKVHFPILLVNASTDLHLDKDALELKDSLCSKGADAECHIIQKTNHFTIISRIGGQKDKTTPIVKNWLKKQLLKKLTQEPEVQFQQD